MTLGTCADADEPHRYSVLCHDWEPVTMTRYQVTAKWTDRDGLEWEARAKYNIAGKSFTADVVIEQLAAAITDERGLAAYYAAADALRAEAADALSRAEIWERAAARAAAELANGVL